MFGLKYVRRILFYTALSSTITVPVAYRLGYKKAEVDIAFQNRDQTRLERIAQDKYSVISPDDHQEYTIDFSKQQVNKSIIDDADLLELFSR